MKKVVGVGPPPVQILRERPYLKEGTVYTSAGITAGIDLSLALVEEKLEHKAALDVAKLLVMFLVRPGGQKQYSHMLSRQAVASRPLRELQAERIGMILHSSLAFVAAELPAIPGD